MTSAGALPAVSAEEPGVPRQASVLAPDIGGTKLAAGVVDPAGRVHSFVVVPTEVEQGPKQGLA
jgi:predicted NBD/HSP70 family sugar kinase